MSDKKGIVDPWRIVEPVKQTPAPTPLREHKRIDLRDPEKYAEHIDADLAVNKVGQLDSKHGSIVVSNPFVSTMNSVVREIVGFLFNLQTVYGDEMARRFESAGIAFIIGTRQSSRRVTEPAAYWATEPGFEPHSELRFCNQTLDAGMLKLILILRQLQRRPAVTSILRKWGVRIIQR